MHKLLRMTTMTLPSVNTMYRALTERDSTYDGVFFAAIRTTGVFCRPTCVAKKPRPQNVEFYSSIGDAVSAGYRPCKRCRPMEPAGKPPEWLEQLLARVEAEPTRRWKDEDLRRAELDPGRVRRWFLRHHGITFHAYQRARRLGLALGHIRHGEKWEGVGYTHGFDSASGFHDAFTRAFDRAPSRGDTLAPLVVARLLTPLGPMIAGATAEGICLLEFSDRRMLETQIGRLEKWFNCAVVPGEHEHISRLEEELELYFARKIQEFTVPVVLRGTPFQVAAWQRLQRIPYGETISYEQQAREIGRTGAHRAIGRANGDNRIAIVVPCHRVVKQNGELCGYGGGLWRKKFLLDLERGVAVGAIDKEATTKNTKYME